MRFAEDIQKQRRAIRRVFLDRRRSRITGRSERERKAELDRGGGGGGPSSVPSTYPNLPAWWSFGMRGVPRPSDCTEMKTRVLARGMHVEEHARVTRRRRHQWIVGETRE